MKDRTREVGQFMQEGVRDARAWTFGPFIIGRMEHRSSSTWSLELNLRFVGVSLSFWRRTQ